MVDRAIVFLAERIEQCLADDYVPIKLDKEEATLLLKCLRDYQPCHTTVTVRIESEERDGK